MQYLESEIFHDIVKHMSRNRLYLGKRLVRSFAHIDSKKL